MQTRFLFTCISSLLFAGEKTLDQLHDAFARDSQRLFHDGVDVSWYRRFWQCSMCVLQVRTSSQCCREAQIGDGTRLYFVCIGVKGDQVYLRKVFWLEVLCVCM